MSNIGNTKRHYKQTHMEQLPQSCKVCHMELRNQAACDAHMKATHNITNREIKMAKFVPMSGLATNSIFFCFLFVKTH